MPRISLGLCLLALIGLLFLGRTAAGYERLYFAGPKLDASASTEKIEDLNLACETAALVLDVTVVRVNQAYARILGYEMRSGSFFTQTTLDEKRNHVVLNEKLAFETFGNFDVAGNIYKIRGEPYLVVGVVADGRAEKTAYLPVLDQADSFLAVMATEEKTVAEMKSLGINENRFYLANLSEVADSVRHKPWLALAGAGLLLLAALLYKTAFALKNQVGGLRRLSREQYPGELLRSRAARRLTALALAGAAGGAAWLWLFLKAAALLLHWVKYADSLQGVTTPAFGGLITDLQNLGLYSNILLVIFIGGALLGFVGIKSNQQNL